MLELMLAAEVDPSALWPLQKEDVIASNWFKFKYKQESESGRRFQHDYLNLFAIMLCTLKVNNLYGLSVVFCKVFRTSDANQIHSSISLLLAALGILPLLYESECQHSLCPELYYIFSSMKLLAIKY